MGEVEIGATLNGTQEYFPIDKRERRYVVDRLEQVGVILSDLGLTAKGYKLEYGGKQQLGVGSKHTDFDTLKVTVPGENAIDRAFAFVQAVTRACSTVERMQRESGFSLRRGLPGLLGRGESEESFTRRKNDELAIQLERNLRLAEILKDEQ